VLSRSHGSKAKPLGGSVDHLPPVVPPSSKNVRDSGPPSGDQPYAKSQLLKSSWINRLVSPLI
jgi:hypothetical protein